MSVERSPMTPEGYEKIRKDLQHLKSVVRPQNIQDIEEARAHGDLSENAEYHAAKEKQGEIAAQINHFENLISTAEVIDPKTIQSDRVVFSATVTVYDVDLEDEVVFQIVGDQESDIKHGKIAISSPIARGLIGKTEGDEVGIKTPKGIKEYEIVKIEYK